MNSICYVYYNNEKKKEGEEIWERKRERKENQREREKEKVVILIYFSVVNRNLPRFLFIGP